jgi:hypothetical protein
MSKKTEKKKVLTEVLLNVNQTCNEFQLVGTTRIHVLKKFKSEEHTQKEWDIIFHRERVLA